MTPFSSRVPFDMAIETADRVMYERKKALKQMRGDPLQRRERERRRPRATWDNDELTDRGADPPRRRAHPAIATLSRRTTREIPLDRMPGVRLSDRGQHDDDAEAPSPGSLRRWSTDRSINDGRPIRGLVARRRPGASRPSASAEALLTLGATADAVGAERGE